MKLTRMVLFSLFAALPLQAQSTSGGLQASWTRHYTTGLAPSKGEAILVATDREGYVYVTGTSHAGLDGSDFLTIKYDPTGKEIWSRRYNHRPGSEDVPSKLAIDGSGNVIVCGSIANDCVTIKYDGNGDVQWIRTYTTESWYSSAPLALAIDDTGNVFVLGKRSLFKYSPSGEQRWPAPSGTALIGGPEGQRQDASLLSTGAIPFFYHEDLGIDDSGFVYLLWGISNWGWVNRYVEKIDGGGNALWSTGLLGSVGGIAVDGAGNSYFTGYEYEPMGSGDLVGYDGNADFLSADNSSRFSLSKLDASGKVVWTRVDSTSGNRGVSSLTLDSTGHLFMKGNASVVCYDTSGHRLWLVRGGTLMAVDAGGNVTVADTIGGGGVITRYNLGFDSVWTRYVWTPGETVEQMRSLAVDGGGNVYSAGMVQGNYATFGFHPTTGDQWVRTVSYRAPGGSYEYLSGMALDGNGNIVLAGTSGRDWTSGFLTVAFTPAGDTLWARTVAAPESSWCNLNALAMDRDNNTVALGWIGRSTLGEMHLFKRSPTGELLWSVTFGRADSSIDSPTSLAVDHSGNIYVTGTRTPITPPTSTSSEFLIMKFTDAGNLVWSRTYPVKGAGGLIAVGTAGSIVVMGTVFESGARPTLVVKYDSAGTVLWEKREAPHGNGFATDRDGNVYTIGQTVAPDVQQNYPFVTTKYGSGGELVWSREFKYYAVGNGQDGPRDVAIDDSGNVYVTGTSSIDTWMDIVTIKYSPGGQPIWVRRYKGDNYVHDSPSSMAIDSRGNVYVTGNTTLRYSRDGVEEVIGGDGSRVLVDQSDNVYVGGTTMGTNGNAMTVTKYSPITVSLPNEPSQSPHDFLLEQNYPNPFNPTTDIRFRFTDTRWVNVSVYDMLGREVAVLVNGELAAGQHMVRWNAANQASGVYFYRLKAGADIGWRRMLLIR